ncbi:glycosyltransferase family 4 protein [Chitinophagaceae bacterium LB-8]|uniref:Glycosyltransferase family 4 protein n=1 Tax=Paraflavisolibacter caeni TaxID=2982496 RepID=A0A9X3B993_9BACT|nr:glycosyltransferase family 4 protein [Paraflavisolibacter caeni]MCU7550851.1 glycosyltransferase family 4 protein [Paraflavisolibacter caeni]
MKPPKKKILFLAQLPPPVHGASIMNNHVLNSSLIRSEFDIIPLPLQFANSIADISRIRFKKIWLMVIFCFRLVYTVIKFRPNVAYFTIAPVGGAFYRDAFFSFILRVLNVKRLYHLHGKGIQQEIADSAIKRMLYRLVFQKSNVIILARILQKDIESIYKGRPFVLPCGVPEDSYYNSVKASRTEPVILYLSNLVLHKGIDIFLECINLLHKKNYKFKAYIVGAPFDVSLEHVQQFIQKNELTTIAEVRGPLYGDEKKKILMESDILVFPSYYKNEAFPVTILEAMQAGIPIIASNNGGIQEMIDQGQTGFVAPIKDREAILEKVELLINDPELRASLGRKAKQKFHQFYTIEIFEQSLLRIFEEVT